MLPTLKNCFSNQQGYSQKGLPWLILVMGALLQVACSSFPHKLPPTGRKAQQALQALQQQQQTRTQLQALLQVRAVGVTAMMMATQHIDVVVQSPARLLLSWRSFFDQPALAASYDGQHVCLFEPSQHPRITCQHAAAHDPCWLHTIPLQMSPQQIAAALLGVVPNLQNSQLIAFALNRSGRQHQTVLLHPNGSRSMLRAYVSTGVLTRYELHDANGHMQYRLDYETEKQTKHNMFPQRIRLNTLVGKQRMRLNLEIKQAQWNGAPLPQTLFHLGQNSSTP